MDPHQPSDANHKKRSVYSVPRRQQHSDVGSSNSSSGSSGSHNRTYAEYEEQQRRLRDWDAHYCFVCARAYTGSQSRHVTSEEHTAKLREQCLPVDHNKGSALPQWIQPQQQQQASGSLSSSNEEGLLSSEDGSVNLVLPMMSAVEDEVEEDEGTSSPCSPVSPVLKAPTSAPADPLSAPIVAPTGRLEKVSKPQKRPPLQFGTQDGEPSRKRSYSERAHQWSHSSFLGEKTREDSLAAAVSGSGFFPMESDMMSGVGCDYSAFGEDMGTGYLNKKHPAKVLLIYTGGTLGMRPRDDGAYAPDSSFLSEVLSEMPEMKDPMMPEVDVHALGDPLDSSDVEFEHWISMVKCIKDFYHDYDGFVVAHGTDTMAFTASALSFMLRNLNKPVVVTGSMIPLCMVRSDARSNLLDSLLVAGRTHIPEVVVVFDREVMRGNRVRKLDAVLVPAFKSPNYPPLGHAGVHLTIDPTMILDIPHQPFECIPLMSSDVILLKIHPGFGRHSVRSLLMPPTRGVVLEAFGSGNAPHTIPALCRDLKAATDAGVVVIVVSACNHAWVNLDLYEAGKFLRELGCISGVDMTPEAAFTKLSFLLGQKDTDITEIKSLMGSNMVGELTEEAGSHKQHSLMVV